MPSMAVTDLPTEAPSMASTTLAPAMPGVMLSMTARPPRHGEGPQNLNGHGQARAYGFPGVDPRHDPQGDQNPPRHIPRGFVGPVCPDRWGEALGRWVWSGVPVGFPLMARGQI